LSYFYAINSTETLLNIPRLGNTFFAVFFCFLLLHNLENKVQIINRIFLGFLLFELSSFYGDFFTELESSDFVSMNLKGVAGNKNITSASIAFKIPFVLYSLITASRKLVKAILFFMLFLAAFAVSILDARAAILSSSIVFFIFIIFLFFTLFNNKNDRKKKSRKHWSNPHALLIGYSG
jgi:O-antigen ligase